MRDKSRADRFKQSLKQKKEKMKSVKGKALKTVVDPSREALNKIFNTVEKKLVEIVRLQTLSREDLLNIKNNYDYDVVKFLKICVETNNQDETKVDACLDSLEYSFINNFGKVYRNTFQNLKLKRKIDALITQLGDVSDSKKPAPTFEG